MLSNLKPWFAGAVLKLRLQSQKITGWRCSMLQLVPTATTAPSSVVTVTMPAFYTLPAVQTVPRVAPISQTAIRPAETVTTVSRNKVALPPLLPVKSAATAAVASAAAISQLTAIAQSASASATKTSLPAAVSSSPTSGSRPILRVIIPNTRTADDVRCHYPLIFTAITYTR